jgi:hypothetical protein
MTFCLHADYRRKECPSSRVRLKTRIEHSPALMTGAKGRAYRPCPWRLGLPGGYRRFIFANFSSVNGRQDQIARLP